MISNQKGYSLISVLLVFACLSILGLALLGATTAGMKLRVVESQKQYAFYAAEAGLDKVYGQIALDIQNCYEKAAKKAEEFVALDIEAERTIYNDYSAWKYVAQLDETEGDIPERFQGFDTACMKYFTADGTQDYKKIYSAVSELYAGEFQELFNDAATGYASYAPEIELFEHQPFNTENELSALTFNSMVSPGLDSKYDYAYTVQVTYNISVPEYRSSIDAEQTVLEIEPNILFTKALVSDQDIIFTGENISVYGDIYARGKGKGAAPKIEDFNFGGIWAGDSTAGSMKAVRNLNIYGSVSTEGNVRSYAADTAFSIYGPVFCRNLAVWNGNVKVNGSIATKNKLMLMDAKSSVEIQGDYYGFSDTPVEGLYDSSSSILINSQDISDDNGSSLRIYGKTYIAGVGFLDIRGTEPITGDAYTPYQLGESLSVKGNYIAYGIPIDDEDGTDNIPEGFEKYGYSKIKFEQIADYFLAATGFTSPADEEFSIFDKADYFYAVNEYIKGDSSPYSSVLDLGTSSDGSGPGSIFINDMQYSLGAYISNGTTYRRSTGGYEAALSALETIRDEYNLSVSKFGDGSITCSKLFADGEDGFINAEAVTEKAEWLSDTELFVISPDAASPVWIGDTLSAPSNAIKFSASGKAVSGVVITAGDVYVSGNDITYTGTVIAGGNIYVNGKNISIINGLYDNKIFEQNVNSPLLPNVMLTIIKSGSLDECFLHYNDKRYKFIASESEKYSEGIAIDPRSNLDMKKIISIKDWKRVW